MNEDELQTLIDRANDRMVVDPPEEEVQQETVETVSPQGVDLFQERQVEIRDMSQHKVRGAKKKLLHDLDDLLDSGIEEAYRKTLDDSDLLRAEGETQRARLLEEHFMQQWYRPTVDALIRMNSQQEVLASDEALGLLDNFAIVPGRGKGNGYTSVYVSSLYEPVPGQQFTSDAEVQDAIRRINVLLDERQVRSASALANRMQQSIDAGNNRATPEDYDFLQKIVLRTS